MGRNAEPARRFGALSARTLGRVILSVVLAASSLTAVPVAGQPVEAPPPPSHQPPAAQATPPQQHRINHLDPFRLGPWDRETSAECFERLAASHDLRFEDGVAYAVHDRLGIGIPHHVQSFFARLREFAIMHRRQQVTMAHVDEVYRTALLGPWGQSDLIHYETRLRDGLDDDSYSIAMEILAEAATQTVFSSAARRALGRLYTDVVDDVFGRIAHVLDVLVHDGYLEGHDNGYRFPSRLLKDWWSARFRDHHVPLAARSARDA